MQDGGGAAGEQRAGDKVRQGVPERLGAGEVGERDAPARAVLVVLRSDRQDGAVGLDLRVTDELWPQRGVEAAVHGGQVEKLLDLRDDVGAFVGVELVGDDVLP